MRVFYSYHFELDVFRANQIRNTSPMGTSEWERIERSDGGVKRWINKQLRASDCLVVLIGEETYERPLVLYEIETAWRFGLGVLGVRIDQIKCARRGTCDEGPNPFEWTFAMHEGEEMCLADVVEIHDPWRVFTFKKPIQIFRENIEDWVDDAIGLRERYE